MGRHAERCHMKGKTQAVERGCGFSQLQQELGSGCKLHVRQGAQLLPTRQPKGRVLHPPTGTDPLLHPSLRYTAWWGEAYVTPHIFGAAPLKPPG